MHPAAMSLPFKQVDVFTSKPFKGNPVAVINCLNVDDKNQLTDKQLQDIATWTNLSETTFLFKPKDPQNDYYLRIFTPKNELPFAGHPTVGSSKAFMEFTNKDQTDCIIRQECGVGIVQLTVKDGKSSFKAEQTTMKSIDQDTIEQYAESLGVKPIATPKLLDVGPKWVVFLVGTAQECYDANPNMAKMAEISKQNDHTGIILGGLKNGNEYEMRAFAPVINVPEDPVCGSGALSFIRYLQDHNGYTETTNISISQGGRVNRDGLLSCQIAHQENGEKTYHVGGNALTVVEGTIRTE